MSAEREALRQCRDYLRHIRTGAREEHVEAALLLTIDDLLGEGPDARLRALPEYTAITTDITRRDGEGER
jgi:hypothetical protein